MIEQIRKILAEGENQHNEFKKSHTRLNKNTFDSICAFLNRNGGNSDPILEEGDVFKTIISIPQIYSIKGKSEGKSKVAGNIAYSDTENIKNDTGDIKNDTESLTARIYDAVNDAVIKKVRLRLVEIIKVLIDTPGLKPSTLSEKLNVSEVTIKRDMQKIKDLVIYKGGQSKGGYYLTSNAIEKIRL